MKSVVFFSDSMGVAVVFVSCRYGWLRYNRDTPPSESEIESEAAAAADLKARVAILEEADAKLRLQEIAEKQLAKGGQSGGGGEREDNALQSEHKKKNKKNTTQNDQTAHPWLLVCVIVFCLFFSFCCIFTRQGRTVPRCRT